MKPRFALLACGVLMLAAALLATLPGSPAIGDDPPAAAPAPAVPWTDILSASAGANLPEPLDDVIWRDDIEDALREAKKTGRPLLVTFRCLPCKQCSEFDATVLEATNNPADKLLRQFITVRVTTMAKLDLRYFPIETHQDMDMSWWGYLMNSDGRIYACYGGRDEVSDKTRISLPGFMNVMQRVLDFHYDPRSKDWTGVIGDLPRQYGPGRARTIEKLPGYRNWDKTHQDPKLRECLHCHQVQEILWQPLVDKNEFDPKAECDMWPLPENVGLSLDRDHGLKVTAVTADGAAAKAGIKVGDELCAANGLRVFGQTDFRGVLHRGPQGAGSIELMWRSGTELKTGTLTVAEGWRATVLDWRMSVSQGNWGPYTHFWALKASGADRQRAGAAAGTMAIKPWMGQNPQGPAFDAGLRPNHVIVAIDGQSPDVDGRSLQVWVRFRYKRGDTVTLTVVEPNGQKKDIKYRLPLKEGE